jgi:hypothetical protein
MPDTVDPMPDRPIHPEISGETLIRLLDGLSALLLDAHDIVAGDPDVRLATAAVAEQVGHQLRADGWRDALGNRNVVARLAAGRVGR